MTEEKTEICDQCGIDSTLHWNKTWMGEKLISIKCDTCTLIKNIEAYKKDKKITSKLSMEATLARARKDYENKHYQLFDEINTSVDRLDALVKYFDRKVWQPEGGEGSLSDLIHAQTGRGASGIIVDPDSSIAKIMSYVLAGRIQFTIEGYHGEQITLITEDKYEPSYRCSPFRMGVNSWHGTEEELSNLLIDAIAGWARGNILIEEDQAVRLAGF